MKMIRELCALSLYLRYKIRFLSLLTPWSRVLLEKLTGSHLIKKFSAFYGTRKFITAFTSARHLSLSWTRSIQSIHPHPTSRRSTLILSSHLRLGLSRSPRFPHQNPICNTPLPHSATCPAHLILLDFITRIILGAEYGSLSFSLCGFIHSPVTSFLLRPRILLNTLFSNTLSHLMYTSNKTLDLIFIVLQPAKQTPPKTSRTKAPTHNELRTRRQIW